MQFSPSLLFLTSKYYLQNIILNIQNVWSFLILRSQVLYTSAGTANHMFAGTLCPRESFWVPVRIRKLTQKFID
jgi:hypothetical protein